MIRLLTSTVFAWMVYLGVFLDGHLGQFELVMIYTYYATTSYQITKTWISLNYTKWKKRYIPFVHPPFEDTHVVSWRRDKRQRIQRQSRSSSLMFEMNLVSWTTTRTVFTGLAYLLYISKLTCVYKRSVASEVPKHQWTYWSTTSDISWTSSPYILQSTFGAGS